MDIIIIIIKKNIHQSETHSIKQGTPSGLRLSECLTQFTEHQEYKSLIPQSEHEQIISRCICNLYCCNTRNILSLFWLALDVFKDVMRDGI